MLDLDLRLHFVPHVFGRELVVRPLKERVSEKQVRDEAPELEDVDFLEGRGLFEVHGAEHLERRASDVLELCVFESAFRRQSVSKVGEFDRVESVGIFVDEDVGGIEIQVGVPRRVHLRERQHDLTDDGVFLLEREVSFLDQFGEIGGRPLGHEYGNPIFEEARAQVRESGMSREYLVEEGLVDVSGPIGIGLVMRELHCDWETLARGAPEDSRVFSSGHLFFRSVHEELEGMVDLHCCFAFEQDCK